MATKQAIVIDLSVLTRLLVASGFQDLGNHSWLLYY